MPFGKKRFRFVRRIFAGKSLRILGHAFICTIYFSLLVLKIDELLCAADAHKS